MEGPIRGPEGYPPPTLVRKRRGKGKALFLLLGFVVLALGAYLVAGLLQPRGEPAPASPPAAPQPAPSPPPPPVADADKPADAVPEAPAAPSVIVETPDAAEAAAQPSVDGRKANQWYYVGRLGDGPGAIYSRTGGQWNYAFACNPAKATIEIIATGTGDPAGFDRQMITVGTARLAMDATYSRDGGGVISTVLPAKNSFFDALDGSTPMEIQLVATRKAVVPVGPALVRLIRTCRGRG